MNLPKTSNEVVHSDQPSRTWSEMEMMVSHASKVQEKRVELEHLSRVSVLNPTYSSTTVFSHGSSLAMAEYSSLYGRHALSACSKHCLGNKLGKSVTGAVVASGVVPVLSSSVCTKEDAGRTARPCAPDQSFRLLRRYSLSSPDSEGGYVENVCSIGPSGRRVGL